MTLRPALPLPVVPLAQSIVQVAIEPMKTPPAAK
jgi:hypothetical protein